MVERAAVLGKLLHKYARHDKGHVHVMTARERRGEMRQLPLRASPSVRLRIM
jgi:hypothetical protein